jgi:uncharacterized protein involved in copper resistance
MADSNKRLTVLHEVCKKVAYKEETKKALEFLDKKLNQICFSIEEASYEAPKLHFVDLGNNSHPALLHSPKQHQSQHSTDPSQAPSTLTKRAAESVHSRFRQEHRFNEELATLRSNSAEKAEAGTTQRGKTALLKERSAHILAREREQEQTRGKSRLKRQKLIFEYDA